MALALAVGKANEECAPYRSIGTQVTKSKQELIRLSNKTKNYAEIQYS